MELKELYKYTSEIGVLTFSTIHNGEVHSRSAHFNGYDEDGLYFRTMSNKPYFRQLRDTKKVTVAGISNTKAEEVDGHAQFPPSFSIRLIGDIRNVSAEEIIEKAKTNDMLKVAALDIEKYPAMGEGNFVLHSFKAEIFDVDFGFINRDHKLQRTRFAFGGATFNPAGVRINDNCIECGACEEACSFSAIEAGTPYRCNPERCDDCGSCILACPADAIEESLVF